MIFVHISSSVKVKQSKNKKESLRLVLARLSGSAKKRKSCPISIHMLRRARAPVYLRREAGMRGRMALNT